MERQHRDGLYRPCPTQPSWKLSLPSLRTDVAPAREEIKTLKAERDVLRQRVERLIGDQIREIDRSQITDRISELEQLSNYSS
jgi:cell division protein FtsB